jgi:branched-subunit amino acid ABC-type transport system permease component
MATLVQILAQGLAVGAVLLLSALGLAVIYGVMGVVNLAHGEFVMLGAYAMVLLSGPLPAWAAIVLAPLIVGAIGLVADRALVRRLYHEPVKSMLGTFGLALVIRQLVLMIEGPELRYVGLPLSGSVPIGFGEQFPTWRLALIVCALLATAAVALWLTRSDSGLRVRTATADAEIAQTLGIDISRVNAATFAAGTALAGFAGALIAPLGSVYPGMGTTYLVGAFLVVVLAGLGNLRSLAAWALGVGLLTAAVAVPANDLLAQVVVWCAALAVVAMRRDSLLPARV